MSIERWAFSESELENPERLNRRDTLLASLPHYEDSVIVYRNGEVSNQWDDGTVGISSDEAELADEVDELYHPDIDEYTDRWRDVEVDREGNFVRFAEAGA